MLYPPGFIRDYKFSHRKTTNEGRHKTLYLRLFNNSLLNDEQVSNRVDIVDMINDNESKIKNLRNWSSSINLSTVNSLNHQVTTATKSSTKMEKRVKNIWEPWAITIPEVFSTCPSFDSFWTYPFLFFHSSTQGRCGYFEGPQLASDLSRLVSLFRSNG